MDKKRKFDHIGIAVRDIEDAAGAYSLIFGEGSETEYVEREGVKTKFFKAGETRIELLESAREESAIAKFIEKRGEGLHHIAIEVSDIAKDMAELQERGIIFTKEEPTVGSGGHKVAFIHPKSPKGLLLELIERN